MGPVRGFVVAVVGILMALPAAPAGAAGMPVPQDAARSADIESERTPFSRTWPSRDGGRITRVSASPLFWRDPTGKLRDFDLGVAPTADGALRADVGGATALLPGGSQRAVVARDGAHSLSLTLLDGKQVQPEIEGSRATYRDVAPGVTRRLRAVPGGVKEDLVLANPASRRSFSYELRLSDGLVPSIARGGDVVVRSGASVVFRVPRGAAFEQARPGALSPVDYELEPSGEGRWRLRLKLQETWFADERRRWPVVVDPTLTWDRVDTAAMRQCVTWDSASCFATGTNWVEAGWTEGLGERLFPFFTDFSMPSSLTGFTITSAKLHVTVGATSYSGPWAPSAYRLQAALGGPGVPSEYLMYPLSVISQDAQTVTANSSATFDVTGQVRRWNVSGKPSGVGIGLRPTQMARDVSSGEDCNNQELYICDGLSVQVGSHTNSDAAKRPYLDIYSAPPAQSGSEIVSPIEGKLTSRFLELTAKATSSNVTSASFEYSVGDSADWQPIPLAALRETDTGTQPSAAEIPVSGSGTSRYSTSLTWDLARTPGLESDGSVHVRAFLDAGAATGGGVTAPRNVLLDRKNPETASSVEIGPADVNLMTGDAVITETDADVSAFLDDLSLTRSFHSRGGGSRRTQDMFGPGWVSSFEADGGEMPYRSIYNFTEVDEEEELTGWSVNETEAFWESYDWDNDTFNFDTLDVNPVYETIRHETSYAVLEQADGSKLTFRKDGSNWVTDDEHPDITVTETAGGFSVKDADGGVTDFEPDSAGAPQYRPVSYRDAGSSKDTTLQYTVIGGRRRLSRIVAPTLAGVSCGGSPWSAGCRALELQWGTVTVAGKSEDRVTALKLRAVDPSGVVTGDSHTIATYEYDSAGRLKKVSDPRTSTGLATQYAYDAQGRLTTYTPPGERPWTLAYQTVTGDDGIGRVRSITRKTPAGADATTTLVYDVPLSGSGAPHNMSASAVDAWGQGDRPATATAVFPPDTVPSGSPPSSWDRATIHYLGQHGKTVNVADPEGGITTTEYDDRGNVVRQLTARNRERALAASGSTADRSDRLDTQYSYATNYIDLIDEIGPEHEIRRPNGDIITGRSRTRRGWDEGRPSGITGDQHLLTSETRGTLLSDGQFVDKTVKAHAYSDGGSDRGWQVKRPLRTTVGEGTDAAITTFRYDADYPLLVEKRLPKASGTDSHATLYHYYGVGSGLPGWCSSGSGLSNAAAAGGLLCAALPGAQPASGPDLPGTYTRYSLLWDPVEERQATSSGTVASSPLRTTTIGRDVLGRETSRAVAATTGRAIPTVSSVYDAATGRLTTTTSAAIGSDPARAITRSWDDNGRLGSYTDGDAGTTTYTYDLNGRNTQVADPRGTRTVAYDDRDEVSGVTDSTLSGVITATRDADGELVEQLLPGGLKMTRTIDASGDPVDQRWERTSGCSGSSCTWSRSTVTRDGLGRFAVAESGTATTEYGYDALSRLESATEQRGAVCTQRDYAFDKNSNRTSLTTHVSGSGGACGTGSSTTRSNTLDGADRLKNTGYAYDALGRTTSVPAADSPDGNAITLTYDTDDLAASINVGPAQQTLTRDPLRRLRSETSQTTGLASQTSVLRYADDEDAPTARTGTWGWERYVTDADGTQLATVADSGTATWELTDLRGDVVATAPTTATSPSTGREYDEFGNSTASTGTMAPKGLRHGWLGGYGKHTAFTPGGLVHMGARIYNPTTGRFLQVDPIEGGSANAYDYVDQDPLNALDLLGESKCGKKSCFYSKTKSKVPPRRLPPGVRCSRAGGKAACTAGRSIRGDEACAMISSILTVTGVVEARLAVVAGDKVLRWLGILSTTGGTSSHLTCTRVGRG